MWFFEVYPRLLTFCSILAFSLWFNYLLTQVHLIWSFLNVRASDLKCEPSFGLCNSPRLMQTANKGPPKLTAAVGLLPRTCFLLQCISWVLCERGLDALRGSGVCVCVCVCVCIYTYTHMPSPMLVSLLTQYTHIQFTEGGSGDLRE